VRGADVVGSDLDGRRQLEAHVSKVPKRLPKSVEADVLQEDASRLHFGDEACDFWPQVSVVSLASFLPRNAEWLAWESSSEEFDVAV
jgi:hypothetical protein